jgi:hypothetical protein
VETAIEIKCLDTSHPAQFSETFESFWEILTNDNTNSGGGFHMERVKNDKYALNGVAHDTHGYSCTGSIVGSNRDAKSDSVELCIPHEHRKDSLEGRNSALY